MAFDHKPAGRKDRGSPPRADHAASDTSALGAAVALAEGDALGLVAGALQARRVRLAFQPVVVRGDAGRVAFYEGFIRILDPGGRMIPARDFIHAIETQDLGRQIDCAALQMGLQALARYPDLRLSVNMSARSVGYPGWLRVLRQGLKSHPELGRRLILEVSEPSAMAFPEVVIAFMQDMQRHGIRFALDDFGTSAVALRQFRHFLFDLAKIDGAFTRGIATSPDNQVLVATLIQIARQFDIALVAEGVETQEDAAFLSRIGTQFQQGYLYGSPTIRPAFMPQA
jgi:EAL domain-containing protein (putative c-di-GMP-specific phosphodiesterase class I)